MIRLAVSGQFLMIAMGKIPMTATRRRPHRPRKTAVQPSRTRSGQITPNPAEKPPRTQPFQDSGASQRTPSGGDGDGRGGGAAVPFLLDGLHGAQVADTAAAVGRRGCCPRYLPLGYFRSECPHAETPLPGHKLAGQARSPPIIRVSVHAAYAGSAAGNLVSSPLMCQQSTLPSVHTVTPSATDSTPRRPSVAP